MNRLSLFLAIFALLSSGAFLVCSGQDQRTIDTTAQVGGRPLRERGPFQGSASPGHSAGLPIRLELIAPTGELRPNGTALVDFIITNIGAEPIKLPSSFLNSGSMEMLTLWITSDAIKDQYLTDSNTGLPVKISIVSISAELDSRSDDPKSFYVLAPNQSIRVHASSPQLKAGTSSFTAHAELVRVSNGGSDGIGTADSESVTATLATPNPAPR